MYEDDEILNESETNEEEQISASVPGETKSEKFLRLAPPRVNKVLGSLAALKKLSSSAYEYTPEQAEKMFLAIRDALDDCAEAFKPKDKSSGGFSF